ncbi:MAG: Flp pilus assembly protein, pilin Flp, partial [uncultured Microvirga sp.]
AHAVPTFRQRRVRGHRHRVRPDCRDRRRRHHPLPWTASEPVEPHLQQHLHHPGQPRRV